MARIVLIDDEDALVHAMQMELTDAGHECHCAHTVAEAQSLLDRMEPDLAVIDLKLPDGNGLDLIRQLRSEGRQFPIMVLTAFASIRSAVVAMREGAEDYLEKPVDLAKLGHLVERALEAASLRGRVELYERMVPDGSQVPEVIGESPALQAALELARRVAQPGVESAAAMPSVLLTGETGTGKDLLARYIHATGPLAHHPFVHVDCAVLPRDLIETELFGHEQGAFTDARATKRGLLEMASEGTVFLNEIGELPLDLQGKLLTVLETKRFRRVGGTRDLRADVRIITATNADLEERVREKTFREDLFYRLNAFHVLLPPVRERGDDVLRLAEHFGAQLAKKFRRPVVHLSPAVRMALTSYHWPGNVREIVHVMQRAVLLQHDGNINVQHLGILGIPPLAEAPRTPNDENPDAARIARAMRQTQGNVSLAARILGMSRSTLRRRIEMMRENGSEM